MMQHTTMHRQKGLTMISWMVVIAFLGFQGIIAVKVIPLYMTDSSIKSMWEELPNDSKLVGMSPKEIRLIVVKRLKINSVYDISPDDIKISRSRNEYIITLEYEPRGTIIGSLDYIVSFKHEARIRVQ